MTTPAGDSLQPDQMHVAHARAAGLDVHKLQITTRCACASRAAA